MWHILSNQGYKQVLCGATGDIDRTRASWTSPATLSWEQTCQDCAALVTEELITEEDRHAKQTLAQPPRKRNMAVIRKQLKQHNPKTEVNYQ